MSAAGIALLLPAGAKALSHAPTTKQIIVIAPKVGVVILVLLSI
jgi:hypothetical protein